VKAPKHILTGDIIHFNIGTVLSSCLHSHRRLDVLGVQDFAQIELNLPKSNIFTQISPQFAQTSPKSNQEAAK